MIPRIQTGTSFKGAGLYYLHDKKRGEEKERLTSERLAWTYSRNTMEDEPEAVLAEMRQTAFDQSLLKLTSGNRIDGRPTERPVMTVALAWSPEQSPTREDMIEAGNSFLKHMGWEEHQALFIGHNDTKHPHFHMVINRVHPTTGMTLDDNWSKTRAQRWALAYEREHGHIYCEAREAKYGRDGERHTFQMNYREWRLWQEINKENALDPEYREVLEAGEWSVLKQSQKQERTAFWNETGKMRQDLRKALREEVRGEFAEEWRGYALTKAERMEKLKTYDKETRRAIRHLRRERSFRLKHPNKQRDLVPVRGPDGRTYIGRPGLETHAIEKLKERQKEYHARVREELYEMRSNIFTQQNDRLEKLIGVSFENLSKDRAEAYKEVLARHRDERANLREDQATGTRRQDLLSGLTPKQPEATPLTPQQSLAYVHTALNATAQRAEFAATRQEIADPQRQPGLQKRDEPQEERGQQRATAHSSLEREKRDKDLAARVDAKVEYYLAKRARDRARERDDGGRDR